MGSSASSDGQSAVLGNTPGGVPIDLYEQFGMKVEDLVVQEEPEVDPVDDKSFKLTLVGLGPAGLAVVRTLRKGTELTVIEPKDFYEYTPNILRAFTDPEVWKSIVVPVHDVLKSAVPKNVTFKWIRGHVSVFGARSANVITSDGATLTLPFDSAIVAIGSSSRLWKAGGDLVGHPGSRERSSELMFDELTMAGREGRIRHEYEQLNRAAASGPRDGLPSVLIVGGGIVGVELAAEIVSSFKSLRSHVVLCARSGVLKDCPSAGEYAKKWLARKGVAVKEGEMSDEFLASSPELDLDTAGGAVIKYVCTGSRASVPDFAQPVAKSDRGFLRVDTLLRVLTADETSPWGDGRVFALGDCADVKGLETAINKTIYPAEAMAPIAAYNARRAALGSDKHRNVKAVLDPTITSLGPRDGVMLVSGHKLATGRLAAAAKYAIEKSKMDEVRGGVIGKALWKVVPHI
eukprot:TRINITY_DN50053_c0_g1_i1.p1 TRINITY_DN50053_c0_g1~~TRINITY_DN50053_c0_g1_i1.p1  ORF type:complete len:461 (-),score=73.42 TRINITY_DN50053_c0_g1_i1:25-1407(-)